MAQIGCPQAVAGDEDKRLHTVGARRLRQQDSGVHVAGPKQFLVHARAVRELRGAVEDRIEMVLRKDVHQQRGLAEIALDAGQAIAARILVLFQVDVHHAVTFAQQAPL